MAFPTETVYGLGANALRAEAVAKIFAAKGRPANNPLIVHVAGESAARSIALHWPAAASKLASRFWPGPLTLVVPRGPRIPDLVTAAGPTIAVRAPAHPVAYRLLVTAGFPIAAPSANRSGEISPTTAEHVRKSLGDAVDIIIDGGPTPDGIESTVVDLTTSPPRLLRPGPVPLAILMDTIGNVETVNRQPDARQVPLPSPGMMSRHYAPRTPTECVEGSGFARVAQWQATGAKVGWLTFGEPAIGPPAGVDVIVMPRETGSYASRLYAALHELDDLGLDRIVVELPPEHDDWLAVRDRLRRAGTT